ncbi:transposase, partial [Mycobacterium interjectum]
RRVVEGIIYRYRTGVPWRDLPRSEFGRGRRCGNAIAVTPRTAPGTGYW